jgi:HSP20 family protein
MNNLVKYKNFHNTLPDRNEFLAPFDSFFDEVFSKTFPDLSKSFGVGFWEKGSYPKVDVIEHDDKFIIEAEIPGLKKEDVSVELVDDVLSIKGEKRHDSESKNDTGKYLRRELKRSSFKRSFSLGDNIDKTGVDAEFNNGVLTVILKKVEPSLPNIKKIDIK